jgi:DNA-binding GntR family transcriptional regulator
VLECEAVRCACSRIDLAELHSLEGELKRLAQAPARSGVRYVAKSREADNRLHDLIALSCGNTFLANELGRLKVLFRVLRDVSYTHIKARNDFRRLAAEAHQHLAIVAALLSGDPKEASRAMSRHIKSAMNYWSRALPRGNGTKP